MRLLLVEDDRMIGSSLRQPLRAEGHAVDWVYDAVAANAALTAERFDLVLLDLGLPAPASPAREASGLDVLRALRGRGDATPVIVVTARDASGARVTGLDAGADDYLVKLFDIGELNARVRALMRRQAGRAAPVLAHAGVTLDPATRGVAKDSVPVPAVSARVCGPRSADAAPRGRPELDLIVQGWSADGRVAYASQVPRALPGRAVLGFADVHVQGTAWRSFSVLGYQRVIQGAQPQATRQRRATEAALRSIAPLLLLALRRGAAAPRQLRCTQGQRALPFVRRVEHEDAGGSPGSDARPKPACRFRAP